MEWLLFLHVLSAFLVVAALTALWALVLATRPAAPLLAAEDATRYGRVAGPIVGVGLVGAVAFGIWLAIQDDAHELWEAWIVASLVLWAAAAWAGVRAGQEFERDPVGRRRSGIVLQTLSSLGVLAILVLMIWQPGA